MTEISWTHGPGFKGETWNPLRAMNRETGEVGWTCVRVSPGCPSAQIVAANEPPRPSLAVEAQERSPAAACAFDIGIVLAHLAKLRARTTMTLRVMSTGVFDAQVLRAVVELVTVQVVYLLATPQWAGEHLFGNEPVLVDVAARVRAGMIGAFQQHVAVRGDRAAALPVRVALAGEGGHAI